MPCCPVPSPPSVQGAESCSHRAQKAARRGSHASPPHMLGVKCPEESYTMVQQGRNCCHGRKAEVLPVPACSCPVPVPASSSVLSVCLSVCPSCLSRVCHAFYTQGKGEGALERSRCSSNVTHVNVTSCRLNGTRSGIQQNALKSGKVCPNQTT